MKKSMALFTIAFLLIFSSCEKEKIWGDGPVVTETRNTGNFSGVSSGFSGKVNFTIDPVYKVEVVAQQNILDVLRTNTSNGILTIDYRNNVKVHATEPVIVNVAPLHLTT